MKALTVVQPYASLIAKGIKRVENRYWTTSHRGDLLIHAGANRKMYPPDPRVIDAPYSKIVARCKIIDVVKIPPKSASRNAVLDAGMQIRLKAGLGQEEFISGPWCWILKLVEELDIPFAKGQRGLFDIDLDQAIADGPRVLELLAQRNASKIRKPTRAQLKAIEEVQHLEEWNKRHASHQHTVCQPTDPESATHEALSLVQPPNSRNTHHKATEERNDRPIPQV